MERATEETHVRWDTPRTSEEIPPPLAGGTYRVQSLGRWVDRLMGEDRIRREVDAALAPLIADETEVSPEPEPVEIPEPVPGGTEPITKGGDPPAEQR